MTLLDLLRSPSAYRGQPWAYARNQIGHGYIVGGLPVWLLGPGALVPLLILYAVWEAIQWRRYGADLSDCIEDAAHVLAVALAVALAAPALLLVHALYLAAGIVWRIEQQTHLESE